MIGRQKLCRLVGGLVLALGLVLPLATAHAQYFGRNKVNYEKFDFRVLRTEHFDIHFYPQENLAAQDAARMAERWYQRLSPAFNQNFVHRKPIILYSDHADFQQTNVIGGFISEGTGGVTESLKNRVVMPLTGDYHGTDHVLGHEIVHVFQYDIALAQTDSIPFRLNLLPLWLIEGMAEYLTVGRNDPHTAMWLRDAVLHDDFPSIDALTTDPRYFPYRYGQALWAYVGGMWGDDKISEIYRAAGRRGMEFAFAKVLGVTTDSLSVMWADAVRETYTQAMAGRSKPEDVGKRILAEDLEGGSMNLAPVLSPDGNRVAFISEKDLFSIDVFVADANTGKVTKRLVKSDTNAHFDALRFIDSAGTWSPDGKYIAVVVFARGNNWVLLVDTETGVIKEQIRPKKVGSVSNPAWSPDGDWILFSGSSMGQSDLYMAHTKSRDLVRLTNDRYADLQPAWSPDGKTVAFVTDRGPDTDFEELTYGNMRIGLMNMETRDVRTLSPFKGAKHINPQFSADGKSLYFISDREGFSDIYRLDLETQEVYQVTRIATGVSGITSLSPALTVARTGRVLFSVFEDGRYSISGLEPDEAQGEPLQTPQEQLAFVPEPRPEKESTATMIGRTPGFGPEEPSSLRQSQVREAYRPPAGLLPPAEDEGRVFVTDYLSDPEGGLPQEDEYPVQKYKPKLQLDYIGGYAAGVAVDRFGASVGGGATAYFSDMLGNHVVGVGLQANGSFKDIGAQASYQNRAQRWNWGGVVGHMPFLNVYSTIRETSGAEGDTLIAEQFRERVYLDRGSLFAQYPFSPTRRFEIAAGFTRYSYDIEVERQLFLPNGLTTVPVTEDIGSPPALNLTQASVALVGDDSFLGFTSPIKGTRYRIEVEPTFGTLQYSTFLFDLRRYLLQRPFTLAIRALHMGRYGQDSEDPRLTDFFIGYENLVRGYASGSFDVLGECTPNSFGGCAEFDRLFGSRMAVANMEIRLPFIGTSQWGLINFPYLPTELSAFVDAGVAWSKGSPPTLTFDKYTTERVPVVSAGGSARFNILGALILEVYMAHPFQRQFKGTHVGVLLGPGW